jgi:nucleoside-diphosphate kinase
MAGIITFTIIKPAALKKGHMGHILEKIIDAGFRIVAMKMTKMTLEQAEWFYEIHRDRPFFHDLVEFMSSDPVVVAILEKENAVEEYRRVIGSTDPAKAAEGTIRHLYGESVQKNAVHGSDSDENAEKESSFFFSIQDRFLM